MSILKCEWCNKNFEVSPSRVGKKRFCSKECLSEYRKSKSTIIKCETCGKEFKVYNHELPRKKFCSKECYNISLKGNVEFACSQCGKKFIRRPSHVKTENIYCSKKCLFDSMKNREEKTCSICGKPVIRAISQMKAKHIVCSEECKGKLTAREMRGRNHPNFNSDETKCEVCGTVFFEPKSRLAIGKGRFCSKKCKYEYFSKQFIGSGNPYWSGGAEGYRGPNWEQQRKRALMRDNFTCQMCGSIETLQVHHIKKFSSFDNYLDANRLSNLQTLCLSCHSHIEPRIVKRDGNTVLNN